VYRSPKGRECTQSAENQHLLSYKYKIINLNYIKKCKQLFISFSKTHNLLNKALKYAVFLPKTVTLLSTCLSLKTIIKEDKLVYSQHMLEKNCTHNFSQILIFLI